MLISEIIDDAQILGRYALVRNIILPNDALEEILNSKGNAAAIEIPGAAQTRFLDAYGSIIKIINHPIVSIRAAVDRQHRLNDLVSDAQKLLAFAAAEGRKVEDSVRDSIVKISNALSEESLTIENEIEFLKAYEGLAASLSPVTAESLRASKTFSLSWPIDFKKIHHWSLGRFVNAILFILVLLGTCVTLSYYSQGAFALKRYNELYAQQSQLNKDLISKRIDAEKYAHALKSLEKNQSTSDSELAASKKSLIDAQTEFSAVMLLNQPAKDELTAIPDRLGYWALSPCRSDAHFIFKLSLCSTANNIARLEAADSSKDALALMNIDAARTVVGRLNEVYLPLLMGLLGSHAFILRRVSKSISERSLSPGTAFNHIVRAGLGALAGLASTWLLTSAGVGGLSWANVPSWALAFVAGYGIELVFNFMDRVINAFASK